MNRMLFVLFSGILLLGLTGCAGTETEQKDVDSVELSDQAEEAAEEPVEENEPEVDEVAEDEGEVHEFNEEIVDNDDVSATLIGVEKIVDKDWDEEKIEITFEVENKRDDTIEVQAREVSADGKMIDETMIMMNQEVSGGKHADAVLTIQNFDGDLPEIEDNIEMILHIFTWEFYFENDIDVKINF